MKLLPLLLLLFWSDENLFAQKTILDSTAYLIWPVFEGSPLISNDGQFIAYRVSYGPEIKKVKKTFIQSTQMDWKMEFLNVEEIKFTTDNRHCIFKTQGDSLIIIDLIHKVVQTLGGVADFKTSDNESNSWLVYSLIGAKKSIVIKNLITARHLELLDVSNYWLSSSGKKLVFKTKAKNGSEVSLKWLNLQSREIKTIWEGNDLGAVALDFNHDQLAFNCDQSIWYYKMNMAKPISLANLDSAFINKNTSLGDCSAFSVNGDRVYFYLHKSMNAKLQVYKGAPEIWSYNDSKLQAIQEREIAQADRPILAAIQITPFKFIQIGKYPGELLSDNLQNDIIASSYQLDYRSDPVESWWNSHSQTHFDIVNAKTGERRELKFLNGADILDIQVSPKGRYVLFYDAKRQDYFSYDVTSKMKYNLTENLHNKWSFKKADHKYIRGTAGWLPDDQQVLIYDDHDIWKIDLSGKFPPVNITRSYGLKHNVVFSICLDFAEKIVPKNSSLLLTAFDKTTKKNGFYSININEERDPKILSMGSHIYRTNSASSLKVFDFTPIKAKRGNVFLVMRQNATEAPNYYCTRDFKAFKRLTNFEPQKSYNWYTSELLSWDLPRGKTLQGILYKPEGFDPNKKYPIIFYCYEKLSDGLNGFLTPEYSKGRLDVATYVSNGYLVFLPDIVYPQGEPMQGTTDALISAAKYISQFQFVDSTKMGLQGHSFGAIQINYLITQTNLFAAACSAAGVGDWVSRYGSLHGTSTDGYLFSNAADLENEGQLRMDKSLWENLSGYIKNSPVISAHKVVTPLLIMQGKNDPTCSYANILEFFLGLRRLGKKAWMLVYPEGSHSLRGRDSEDFTIRMSQFFDHYLKNMPAPIWMLDGIPAKNRSYNSGLTLDTTGRTPGPGLLMPDQQKKIDSLLHTLPITITLN
ncbi:dipeptidyl aminopeptidase/acylaminoacyl peptidase [Pedobacter africanus]|uniref:Dipeptidyl aminopeptidase/acylaminoacyl peptidase n=1 Tax=Pedobacter africanus TaxID=151894 RepID=A0ACC6L284_9SPHI|nr:prolyl oligopeptidase family serine peptidase [Pedobacter africanus]MDR6785709.1 dipeptidyl aminopeptidase/acylaminoacyl peptidase [Pedobacter africanus]